jgi:hypothetical protein
VIVSDKSGVAHITHFGIAAFTDEDDDHVAMNKLAREHVGLSTILSESPSDEVGFKGDVWAFACLCYEVLIYHVYLQGHSYPCTASCLLDSSHSAEFLNRLVSLRRWERRLRDPLVF